ncbi:hypothetical protein HC124_00265 [Winkia neuii]|nr:hypothetical protein [Winkia neuii]PMC93199.1 hypothetical protein CJ188_05310 [Actinomyces sp. UMB0918]
MSRRWRGAVAWSLDELDVVARYLEVPLSALLKKNAPAHGRGEELPRLDSNQQPYDFKPRV